MPCWGKFCLIRRRITASAARSASVTGSKSFVLLLSTPSSEVRKNGRMVSPEAVARRPMKAVKSITVTGLPWFCAGGNRGYCLAQLLKRRTVIRPNPSVCLWHFACTNQRPAEVHFWYPGRSRNCEQLGNLVHMYTNDMILLDKYRCCRLAQVGGFRREM